MENQLKRTQYSLVEIFNCRCLIQKYHVLENSTWKPNCSKQISLMKYLVKDSLSFLVHTKLRAQLYSYLHFLLKKSLELFPGKSSYVFSNSCLFAYNTSEILTSHQQTKLLVFRTMGPNLQNKVKKSHSQYLSRCFIFRKSLHRRIYLLWGDEQLTIQGGRGLIFVMLTT